MISDMRVLGSARNALKVRLKEQLWHHTGRYNVW